MALVYSVIQQHMVHKGGHEEVVNVMRRSHEVKLAKRPGDNTLS
jgi:hypothetical protein